MSDIFKEWDNIGSINIIQFKHPQGCRGYILQDAGSKAVMTIDIHLDHVNEAIATIKDQGGEVLYGGNAISGKGNYVEPTLVKAKNNMELVQKETFAPILYLIEYDELSDAIFEQNNVVQGLSSAIFTTFSSSAFRKDGSL